MNSFRNTIAILSMICVGSVVRPAEWEPGRDFRFLALPTPSRERTGFQILRGTETGASFTNLLNDLRSLTNRNLLSGSGVAAGDVDGDGLCDLYFCGLDSDNRLYRNKGNWKFEDITEAAGVACPNQDSMGAVLADIDGDGDLDLLVTSLGGGLRILENDGTGRFKEATDPAGVRSKTGSTSLALADVDGNGTLDLYVANFRPTTIRDRPVTRFQGRMVNGKPTVMSVDGVPTNTPELTNRFIIGPSGNVLELGEPDVLYLNDGKGRFRRVSFTEGSFLDEDGRPLADPPRDWGLAVQFHDFTGDGAPDLYVCNDLFTPDRIWVNDGHGKFRALDRLALRNTSTFSMGVDFADVDRDGNVDFFVVDMLSRDHRKRHVQVGESTPFVWPVGLIDDRPQVSRNSLQVNRGDSTFGEATYYAGLEASEWSWCPVFLDVDLDGWEDILVSSGQLRDFQNMDIANRIEAVRAANKQSHSQLLNLLREFPGLNSGTKAFRNQGNLTFEEKGEGWGFGAAGISQGMCLADLDNDGDLDVAVNNLNGEAGVYRNEGGAPRVAVRLKGLAPNTRGIGARVWVYGGAVPVQTQEMICGGRYLSSDDPMRVFAAGSLTNEMRIEVKWRSGKRSVVRGVKANRIYEIDEAAAEAEPSSRLKAQSPKELPRSNHQPLFEDVSALLGHTHHEEEFNDYGRQPLLPRKLSQLGPGVAWYDVDGDGWEDLIIGSGKGGKLTVHQNDGKGGFNRMSGAPLDKVLARDQTTVLGVASGLLVGSANYEDGMTNGGCIRIYDLKRNVSGESILGQRFSAGPLALADTDGDGDLDLFVGGRGVAGRYPEPADSLLMRNEGGNLVVAQQWEKLGLVSGAVFSDLDGDGRPELILACEWGPVRVFRNEGEKLVAWDAPVTIDNQPSTLNQLTGWWNGVTTGDFDGDGRLDIAASNWGLNSRYRTSREHPRKLYYGDFGGGGIDLIEAYYEREMKTEVPERGLNAAAAALPWIRERVGSFEAYGKASLQELYGDKLKRAEAAEVNTLETMVFLNRGDRFEGKALPLEAQLSPAYAVCVGDCDGDGREDIFLSQNFFAMNPEMTRCDAGRGLWLKGDGKGNFTAMRGQETGVKVYGEQRGAALCDYDGDGRVDLVVTQNGAETKLYRNTRGRPGLRARLKGPAGNPTGVGAILRIQSKDRLGPAREIHAGSGYWSQDSAVQVMGASEPPTQIHVQWPGGKKTTHSVPPAAKEIEIDPSGGIKAVR